MREVDEALARAFAQRTPADVPEGVPPRPHWRNRQSSLPEFRIDDPSEPILRDALGKLIGPPAPGELEWLSQQGDQGAVSNPTVELSWPSLVLTLGRAWGDRFERLADVLIDVRDRRRLKAFLITSCHRAEGRTTLVLALARVLAKRPGRTLLIDADLNGPMLARSLGLRPVVGFDDVVESGQALAEAIIDVPDENLTILPLRAAVARPKDFLASAAWSCSMAKLRREYDMILLDGSPLFTGLSATVLHQSVDAAILVHNRSTTGERAVLRASEVLEGGGVPLLGLAETFT